MKVVIVVTHLLGTGHLSRALTLARAFAGAGHASTVISGGLPVPHLDRAGVTLVQLPPLRSDGVNFTRLLDGKNAEAGKEVVDARQRLLEATLRETQPDVLITELFPFGRRVLRAEFMSLLACANTLPRRPLICASIRDILAPPSKPGKAETTNAIVAEFYDAVLVHSDPEITPLDLSWPVSDTLAPYLKYTGFVAPPAPNTMPPRTTDVLVSAGGGDVGAGLFAAALDAARLDPARQWHVLIGGAQAWERVASLQSRAGPNVRIEPARPDFQQLMVRAGASVSMAGYNTALDVLQTGTPAVFVPFDAGNEVEQTLRATALAELPGITVLKSAEVSGARLLDHVNRVIAAPPRLPLTKGTDGARRTVEIVDSLRRAL